MFKKLNDLTNVIRMKLVGVYNMYGYEYIKQ